jgi:hypothetical protein
LPWPVRLQRRPNRSAWPIQGLRSGEHLQEWVLTHPEIIGPDVMIVTFEFDKWSSAGGEQKDRLDVLGLGKDGRRDPAWRC